MSDEPDAPKGLELRLRAQARRATISSDALGRIHAGVDEGRVPSPASRLSLVAAIAVLVALVGVGVILASTGESDKAGSGPSDDVGDAVPVLPLWPATSWAGIDDPETWDAEQDGSGQPPFPEATDDSAALANGYLVVNYEMMTPGELVLDEGRPGLGRDPVGGGAVDLVTYPWMVSPGAAGFGSGGGSGTVTVGRIEGSVSWMVVELTTDALRLDRATLTDGDLGLSGELLEPGYVSPWVLKAGGPDVATVTPAPGTPLTEPGPYGWHTELPIRPGALTEPAWLMIRVDHNDGADQSTWYERRLPWPPPDGGLDLGLGRTDSVGLEPGVDPAQS